MRAKMPKGPLCRTCGVPTREVVTRERSFPHFRCPLCQATWYKDGRWVKPCTNVKAHVLAVRA